MLLCWDTSRELLHNWFCASQSRKLKRKTSFIDCSQQVKQNTRGLSAGLAKCGRLLYEEMGSHTLHRPSTAHSIARCTTFRREFVAPAVRHRTHEVAHHGAGILSHGYLSAPTSSSMVPNWSWLWYTSLLIQSYAFSMIFKSGDFAGQSMALRPASICHSYVNFSV